MKRSPGPISRTAIAVLLAPVRLYQRVDLAGAAAALQVRADVLGLRGRGGP